MDLIHILSAMAASGTGPAVPPPVADYGKNMRPLPGAQSDDYRSFGYCMALPAGKVALGYHWGKSEPYQGIDTYAHLYRGVTANLIADVATGTFCPETVTDSEPGRDLSDVYGAAIGAGKYIQFCSVSPASIKGLSIDEPPSNDGAGAVVFFRIAADATLQWGPRINLLTAPGAVNPPSPLHTGTVFGKPKPGTAPGEYFACYLTFDYAGSTPGRAYCVRTTDNWANWTFSLIWQQSGVSETDIAPLGAGKVMALRRIDNGGGMTIFYSSDSGATWTAGGDIKIDGWATSKPRIIHLFVRNCLVDLWYVNRDTGFLCVSKGNDPALFFGVPYPQFNLSELYFRVDRNPEQAYHDGVQDTALNPVLGYPSVEYIGSGRYFIMVGKEIDRKNALIYYTYDDLTTDAAAPAAPGSVSAPARYKGPSSARVSVLGYSEAELQKVRYFEIEVAADAAFTQHPSVWYNEGNSTAVHQGGPVAGHRMLAQWISLNQLAANTTYYVRVRAHNNAGVSAWTVGQFTTNAT